jgi:seryl-tRNA(Sec) selenium transferase
MTGLGASIVLPVVIAAMSQIQPRFVEVDQLQRRASA